MKAPTANDQILGADLPSLSALRAEIDAALCAFADELTASDCAVRVRYLRQSGEVFEYDLPALLQHVFNHQTHHRGQVTTLMSQQGVDPGVTDLLPMIHNYASGRQRT